MVGFGSKPEELKLSKSSPRCPSERTLMSRAAEQDADAGNQQDGRSSYNGQICPVWYLKPSASKRRDHVAKPSQQPTAFASEKRR